MTALTPHEGLTDRQLRLIADQNLILIKLAALDHRLDSDAVALLMWASAHGRHLGVNRTEIADRFPTWGATRLRRALAALGAHGYAVTLLDRAERGTWAGVRYLISPALTTHTDPEYNGPWCGECDPGTDGCELCADLTDLMPAPPSERKPA